MEVVKAQTMFLVKATVMAIFGRPLGILCIRMKRCNIRVRSRAFGMPYIFVRYLMHIMLG